MMCDRTLAEWLTWQETLHPKDIELDLARVSTVYHRLISHAPSHFVITVAGTNGKGSSIAMLEAILLSAGYRVGSYTSPHLYRYNERIRINGEMVADEALCHAFMQIEQVRKDTPLTYFEFGTLAALKVFAETELDIVLLEVGLGGRLDAVNIVDPDIALITTIGLDHMDWLGPDREAIAVEKAGIMRQDRPVVCSDPKMPQAIRQCANESGASLYALDHEFSYTKQPYDWCWESRQTLFEALPYPKLFGQHQLQNCAGVLMVLTLLSERFPVAHDHILRGIESAVIPARFQQVNTCPQLILDVAHNPDAAQALAAALQAQPCNGVTRAIVGILQDKNARDIFEPMLEVIDEWHITDLTSKRAASATELALLLQKLSPECDNFCYSSIEQAYLGVKATSRRNDRLVVFGSFYTVAAYPRD